MVSYMLWLITNSNKFYPWYILIMSWATYLENLVILLGFSGFSYSFYQRQKELYFQNLFGQLQKCTKYHLDYV